MTIISGTCNKTAPSRNWNPRRDNDVNLEKLMAERAISSGGLVLTRKVLISSRFSKLGYASAMDFRKAKIKSYGLNLKWNLIILTKSPCIMANCAKENDFSFGSWDLTSDCSMRISGYSTLKPYIVLKRSRFGWSSQSFLWNYNYSFRAYSIKLVNLNIWKFFTSLSLDVMRMLKYFNLGYFSDLDGATLPTTSSSWTRLGNPSKISSGS